MEKVEAIILCNLVYDTCFGGKNATNGYIWGAMGETVTESMLQEWARRAPDQANTILNTGRKWLGKKAWDCSGIRRWLTKKLITPYQAGGATTAFNKACFMTGRLATMPDTPGIWVFRAKAGSDVQMAHVGLYIGGGQVIHAKGTAYGVIKEDISKHAWTHWGADERIIYEIDIQAEEEQPMNVLYEATVVTKTDANINLWSSSAKTKSMIKVPRGDTVEVLDAAAPKGWVYARYRGVTGYADERYLLRIETPVQPPVTADGRFVLIDCGSEAVAKQTAALMRDATTGN